MVKYFAMIAFVLGSLATADSAFAFGRHCRSCGGGGCSTGGCSGGNCYAPVAPSKTAATTNAPPLVAEAPASAPAATATAAQPQNTQSYAYSGRRGLFGRR
ncbi:MAG TPA: hypothetical protein VGI40_09065 [Pirellulaceae bacterium]